MYYVSMSDKFSSGWADMVNRVQKVVIECETEEEVKTVVDNTKHLTEMYDVQVHTEVPVFDLAKYRVAIENKNTSRRWFVKDGKYSETRRNLGDESVEEIIARTERNIGKWKFRDRRFDHFGN